MCPSPTSNSYWNNNSIVIITWQAFLKKGAFRFLINRPHQFAMSQRMWTINFRFAVCEPLGPCKGFIVFGYESGKLHSVLSPIFLLVKSK